MVRTLNCLTIKKGSPVGKSLTISNINKSAWTLFLLIKNQLKPIKTMQRKRFNRAAICSSYNYRASRKAHVELLKENHEKNREFLLEIAERKITKYYIKCFGEKIYITKEEASSLTIKVFVE